MVVGGDAVGLWAGLAAHSSLLQKHPVSEERAMQGSRRQKLG